MNSIARNIRLMRLAEGFSLAELARRANISVVTLHQAESGKPVRPSTLVKIAEALNHNLDELRKHTVPILVPDEPTLVVHRADEALWFASVDHRSKVPHDSAERIQNSAERLRLGQLGLVPMFYSAPNFVMARGPGTTLIELYGEYTGFNSRLYEHVILRSLRGEAEIRVHDAVAQVRPGDAVGFNNFAEMTMAPVGEYTETTVPLLLWIGAVRKGRPLEGDDTVAER